MRIIISGVLAGTYLVWTPGLMEEWYVGRFLGLTLMILGGLFLIRGQLLSKGMDSPGLVLSLFYLWVVGSLWWAPTPSAGFMAAQTIFLTWMTYLLCKSALPEFPEQFYYRLWTGIAVITLGVTTWQLVTLTMAGGLADLQMYRITGLSAHKNLLAAYLFFLTGIQVYYLQKTGLSRWRFILPGLLIILMILIRSRTALLALVLMISVIILHTFFVQRENRRRLLLKIGSYFLIILVVSAGLFIGTGGRKEDLVRLWPAQYLKPGDSGSERLFIWYKTLELIRDKPLTGYGLGNWKIVFPAKGLEGAYRFQSQNVIATRVHNDFLEIWAETGLIGLGLYLSIFGLVWIHLRSRYLQAGPEERSRVIILSGLWLGYLVLALLDFPKERIEHQVFFAWLLALTLPPAWPPGGTKAKNFTFFRRWVALSLGVLLVFNLVLGLYVAKGEWHTLRSMRFAAQKNEEPALNAIRQAYSPFYHLTPLGTPVKWMEGLTAYRLGRLEQAEAAFSIALTQSPHFFPLLNDYAGILVQQGKLSAAEPLYQQALVINPRYAEGMFNLAYVLARQARYAEARNWVNQVQGHPVKKEEFLLEINRLEAQDTTSR